MISLHHYLFFAVILLFSVQAQGVNAQLSSDAALIDDRLEEANTRINGDPDAALAYLDASVDDIRTLASPQERRLLLGKKDRLTGAAYINLNRLPEARETLGRAITALDLLVPEGKEMGEALRTVAYLDYLQGNIASALQSATRAHDMLRASGATRSQALTLMLIGVIYRDAGSFERTLRYYNDAASLASGDPSVDLALENNRGMVQRDLGDYPASLAAYKRALDLASATGSSLLEARVLMNIAQTHIAAESYVEAERAIDRADRLTGFGSSQEWRSFVYGTEAQIALVRQDVAGAQRLIELTFAGQDLAQTSARFRDFHATAVKLYQLLDQPSLALAHLAQQKRLDDEAAELTASANNAILAAEFDFANQELEISNLRASQLEQQIAVARNQAEMSERIIFGILLAAAIIISLILFALQTIRKRRNEVGAANIDLEKSNADLQKALAAKGEFLATTSHEIRTPLNGILGMTQIMLADGAISAGVRERVELVHGAGNTMKAIVDDILDVAKMESGTVAIRREPFALKDALEGVAKIFADQATEKGVEFTLDMDKCPRLAIGDEQRVRQIVLNLISNAVKFTSKGSVTICAAPSVENSENLVVTVADSGIGIPADEVEEIFMPFHQVDGSRTRSFSGTGLGLTISRELAEAMHGTLDVESVEGAGSTFVLCLPLSLELANAAEPRNDSAAVGAGSPVILFAPNPLISMIAARALQGVDLKGYDDLQAALSNVKASGATKLVVVFGTEGTAQNADALSAFHRVHDDVEIYAAGWPDNTDVLSSQICTGYVDAAPELSRFADRLKAKVTTDSGQDSGLLVNLR